MRVSSFRFFLFVLASLIFIPSGNSVNLTNVVLYYVFMTSLAFLFFTREGFSLRIWFPNYYKGILKGIIYFPISMALNIFISILFPIDIEKLQNPQSLENFSMFTLFLLTCVIAPMSEEVMFRGYIQEYLRGRLNPNFTIILSALIFSFYHPFALFPYVFTLGAFLSYIREKQNSLVPGIVVHSMNNILSFLFMNALGR